VTSRVVQQLVQAQKFDEALVAGERAAGVLSEKDALDLLRRVYDQWARRHADAREWDEAVAIYAKALKRFPGDSHLKNNAIATWDAWAGTFLKQKDWNGAIEVYDKGLKAFPSNSHLTNNKKSAESKRQGP